MPARCCAPVRPRACRLSFPVAEAWRLSLIHIFKVYILPVRTMNDQGIGYNSSIVNGIFYAADSGAQVIHLRPVSYTHLDVYKRQNRGSAVVIWGNIREAYVVD